MPADLLFEIGCEEIPAKMLARALADLPAVVERKLAQYRLEHGPIRVFGTPRRIAILVARLADRQPDLVEEVVGPPVNVAIGADGALTKAGKSFVEKNGLIATQLEQREVPGRKGVYLIGQKQEAGMSAMARLPSICLELASALAWPKSMRWGWGETQFVRPVQWLVALFGSEVIPLKWADVTAGRNSRGHRFLWSGPVEISSAERYVETLLPTFVFVDPEARRTLIRADLSRLETETGFRVRPDEALLDEVIHLGEYPVGISGGFDPAYLEVPEEIIVTAMRTHQRYFAMEDASGKLAPRFATMMATIVDDKSLVAKGNETVLAARLADAKFFFAEDRKKTFDEWNQKLAGVVFQAKLGDRAKTIGNKIDRLVAIVDALQGSDVAKRAAKYCKADLASSAVGEFPELQGVMGKHYARLAKHTDIVRIADVIEQHWWPKGQGSELPKTDDAALVALADRIDTVVGCFAVGLEPSGSADPFGLRRAAIGIWQILLDRGWDARFQQLVGAAKTALAGQGVTLKDDKPLDEFFKARLRGIFVDQSIPPQDADAALAQDFRDPVDARARALACAKISREAREVFKRVANILDDARAKKIAIGNTPEPSAFVAQVERDLHAAIDEARKRETAARDKRDYAAVFESLERLRPTVATFFDRGGVMVMDPDPKLRDNRLALLNWFISPYMAIADFRLLGGAS